LERRRFLAVQRVSEGFSIEEVADFLGVHRTTVSRWIAAFHARGSDGLLGRAAPGRPRKLTTTQEKIVLRWLADDPTEHGFPTELWTADRIRRLIEQEFGVGFNPRYLSAWLRCRGITPQKPQRVPRERDPAEIREWLANDWPRIKKRYALGGWCARLGGWVGAERRPGPSITLRDSGTARGLAHPPGRSRLPPSREGRVAWPGSAGASFSRNRASPLSPSVRTGASLRSDPATQPRAPTGERLQKKARRQGAYLALIDESGLLMAPLVRRTLAPRGQTPILAQKSGHREKVSVAAALWLSPHRDRMGMFFKTLVNSYFDNWTSAAFLEALVKELTERVVLVWDGGTMHKGDPIRQIQASLADRLVLEKMPPYAPTLNPVEPVWGWLKWGQLSNFAPRDAVHLNERVVEELTGIQDDQEVLASIWGASELPLPRALLWVHDRDCNLSPSP
jgi:transposase